MMVRIMSDIRKTGDVKEYMKQRVLNARVFIYDEDVFWFDYNGKRFGFSIPEILKLRAATLKSLRRKIK